MRIFVDRMEMLCEWMVSAGLDACLVTGASDVSYLTGFRGENAFLVVSPLGSVLMVVPLYREEAREVSGVNIDIVEYGSSSPWPLFKRLSLFHTVGYDPLNVSARLLEVLRKGLPHTVFVARDRMVSSFRMCKDETELASIRRAVEAAEEAFLDVVKKVRAGMTEKDLADELEYAIRRRGEFVPSFPVVVAAGPRAARPHHVPSPHRIGEGEPIVVDWGVRFDGYCSDMTRTIFVGGVPPRYAGLYRAVLEAQHAGMEEIGVGRPLRAAWRRAFSVLRRYRLERLFIHALGHGIGMDVHEPPALARTEGEVGKKGMVLTVEPGVYKSGQYGIRIEDMVVLYDEGIVRLTSLPVDLEEMVV